MGVTGYEEVCPSALAYQGECVDSLLLLRASLGPRMMCVFVSLSIINHFVYFSVTQAILFVRFDRYSIVSKMSTGYPQNRAMEL